MRQRFLRYARLQRGQVLVTLQRVLSDCDKKASNCCEILVGRSNTCNSSGLASFSGQTPPCDTPYCGGSSKSGGKNFGSWYCLPCTHPSLPR